MCDMDIDVVDIDQELSNGGICELEYIQDHQDYLKQKELKEVIEDFRPLQSDLNSNMRDVLADWLLEVKEEYKLHFESLFLALRLVDAFLVKQRVPRGNVQLLGIAALHITSKANQVGGPDADDFVMISADTYNITELGDMEWLVSNVLNWNIHQVTPEHFYQRWVLAAIRTTDGINGDKEKEETYRHLTRYITVLTVLNYDVSIKYLPSVITASAILLAKIVQVGDFTWNKTLEYYTEYQKKDLLNCLKDQYELLKNHSPNHTHPDTIVPCDTGIMVSTYTELKAARELFEATKYMSVSKINVPENLLEENNNNKPCSLYNKCDIIQDNNLLQECVPVCKKPRLVE